jgi:hypothetical protein
MKLIDRTSLTALVVLHVLTVSSCTDNRAPFSDIEFVEEHSGASDRYVLFTPVLRNNSAIIVGEPAGADYGVLHFRDCDGDGINEAVIETEGNYFGEYSAAVRHVYQFGKDASGMPHAKLVSTEYLPENDPEWVRGKVEFAGDRYCENR